AGLDDRHELLLAVPGMPVPALVRMARQPARLEPGMADPIAVDLQLDRRNDGDFLRRRTHPGESGRAVPAHDRDTGERQRRDCRSPRRATGGISLHGESMTAIEKEMVTALRSAEMPADEAAFVIRMEKNPEHQ